MAIGPQQPITLSERRCALVKQREARRAARGSRQAQPSGHSPVPQQPCARGSQRAMAKGGSGHGCRRASGHGSPCVSRARFRLGQRVPHDLFGSGCAVWPWLCGGRAEPGKDKKNKEQEETVLLGTRLSDAVLSKIEVGSAGVDGRLATL